MHALKFLFDDTGAVTVDYTSLTALVVILGLGLLISLRASVTDVAEDTGTFLQGAEVAPIGSLP
jgi:Flp pilus assembly pilin Flp